MLLQNKLLQQIEWYVLISRLILPVSDNGRSTTTIIFIILGVLLFVGIVIGLIVFCILRQRKKTEEKAYTPID